jgi:MFS family permease
MMLDARRLTIVRPAARATGQIREGLAYVRRHDQILLVLCVAFFMGTFGMNNQMTNALMAQQEFGLGPQEYGILGTFMAVGSLSGALFAARRRTAPRARFVVIMACVFAAVEVAAGLMPSYASYAAVLPVLGLTTLLTLTAANASIQLGVEPRLRGRVMALYLMLLMGGGVLTALGVLLSAALLLLWRRRRAALAAEPVLA